MKNLYYYDTMIGPIGIAEENGFIANLFFADMEKPNHGDCTEKETELLKEAAKQIDEYFSRKRTIFELPLLPCGTEFQKRSWAALQEIAYGSTASYLEIAEKIGCPKGSRAVGQANNKNPIAIIIPCHRVIGKNSKLVGYAGGLDIKLKLLELEGATCKK